MSELALLLQQQHDDLEQMTQLLAQEFAQLKNRQANELVSLAKHKDALLEQIRERDQQLAQSLFVAHWPEYQAQVTQIQAQLRHCHEQNEVNGQLLALTMTALRRQSHFFCQLRDKDSLTYDAKGNPHSRALRAAIKA